MFDYIDTLQKRFGGSGLIETEFSSKDVVQALMEADEISGLTLAGGMWDHLKAFQNFDMADFKEAGNFSVTLDKNWNIGTASDEARIRKVTLWVKWRKKLARSGSYDAYREVLTIVIAGSSAVFNTKIEMSSNGCLYYTLGEHTTELEQRHLEAFQCVLEQFLGK